MHLLKSEGDSTLQAFESSYSFKEDQKMSLPEHSMVQSMNWLKGGQGKKIIMSGTNMPITVLSMSQRTEHGIRTYMFELDTAMTELIADNSDIIAFRACHDQDASIVVTECQILIVHKGGRVIRNHCHQTQAAISSDFVITINDQRKLSIYNVKQLLANDLTVARSFLLNAEVHSMAISNPETEQYLVVNYWNSQSVDILSLRRLIESPSDAFTDELLVQVAIEDYAPFSALDLD